MPTQFLTSNELNSGLEKLFEDAKERLILISPFISLHERYAAVLRAKLQEDKLWITLVFGKNEEDPSRSMRKVDLDFFIQFPNIDIRYEPRLHAKYYANDEVALLTSMNLYKYSQDHNIEAGILMETSTVEVDIANKLLGRTDAESGAWSCFKRVIEQADLIYQKEPQYEKALMGLTKRYSGSVVSIDRLSEFFSSGKAVAQPTTATRSSATTKAHSPSIPVQHNTPASGYCIRTGKPIPFNIAQPLCTEALASWNRYKDPSYKEKYCHFSGELSNGETSVSRPILKKNWKKAKEVFDL